MAQSPGTFSQNFNTGVHRCNGDLICFLHDDDLLTPDSVHVRVRAMQDQGCDALHANAINFYPDGRELLWKPADRIPSLAAMVDTNDIHGATVMYFRSCFLRWGLYDEAIRYAEEYEYNLRLLSGGCRWGYVDAVVARYRRHDEQKSMDEDQSVRLETINQIKQRYGKS